jgi:hypothetical protein
MLERLVRDLRSEEVCLVELEGMLYVLGRGLICRVGSRMQGDDLVSWLDQLRKQRT